MQSKRYVAENGSREKISSVCFSASGGQRVGLRCLQVPWRSHLVLMNVG
uniref:Uncharacterized protein n=1 Tax=Anguilla anguilla TaxID=7936 RepID=A0A0E9W6S0_ANGAN